MRFFFGLFLAFRAAHAACTDGTPIVGSNGFQVDLGLTGNFDHTIAVKLTLPSNDPPGREWILNYGQYGPGSHHWLYNPLKAVWTDGISQMGQWTGSQLSPSLGQAGETVILTTTYDSGSRTYNLYSNGVLLGSEVFKEPFSLTSSILTVGKKWEAEDGQGELDFSGIIHHVTFWDSVSLPGVSSQAPLGEWNSNFKCVLQDETPVLAPVPTPTVPAPAPLIVPVGNPYGPVVDPVLQDETPVLAPVPTPTVPAPAPLIVPVGNPYVPVVDPVLQDETPNVPVVDPVPSTVLNDDNNAEPVQDDESETTPVEEETEVSSTLPLKPESCHYRLRH